VCKTSEASDFLSCSDDKTQEEAVHVIFSSGHVSAVIAGNSTKATVAYITANDIIKFLTNISVAIAAIALLSEWKTLADIWRILNVVLTRSMRKI
jgi:hypothetical protein